MASQLCLWVNRNIPFFEHNRTKNKPEIPGTNAEICGTNAEIHGTNVEIHGMGFDPRCFGPFVGTGTLKLYLKSCTLILLE